MPLASRPCRFDLPGHGLRMALFALALVLSSGSSSLAQTTPPPPLQTIERLDLSRYLGIWHEVAKYPNRFQRQCVANTQAEYRLLADGQILVINRCLQASGDMQQVTGRARQIGAPDSPKLQVRFAPAWLSFLPMVWGNYWVIDLDTNYQLVAVSEPNREYLWILARSPKVDPEMYGALLQRLGAMGFDTQRLEASPHR